MADTKTKDETAKAPAKNPAVKKLPTLAEKVEEIYQIVKGSGVELLGDRLYGPFTEYQIVTTDYGDFGLARGLLLGFVWEERLNKETMQMENVPRSRYFRLTDGERVRGNGSHPDDWTDGEKDLMETHGDNLPGPDAGF